MNDDRQRPKRIQRKRSKGWKMPPNTVYVGRPTRWGNPYTLGQVVHRGLCFAGRSDHLATIEQVLDAYRKWLFTVARCENLMPELRGKDLACWCKEGSPCHADVLLEIANA